MEEWRTELEIERIVVFYNMPVSGSYYKPHMLHLLPLDMEWFQGMAKKKWMSRSIPIFTMELLDIVTGSEALANKRGL